ncbi:MAG: hypothetical protein HFJ10_10695 [Lachnospiraceae bacterium]|jgi:hypothetical protein|nr:hypothetical protein [Lachnospiraceae bacterium]
MVAKLLGYSDINFVSSTGTPVVGSNFYVAYQEEGVTGMKAERFFVKDGIDLPESLKIGEQIQIGFNHKGKVESITK